MFGSWSCFGVAINVCSRTEERIRDGLRQSHKRKSGFLKFSFACFFFFFFLIKCILFWAARSVALNPSRSWKRPWCWERSKVKGGEGGRGWDGWMASLTHWTPCCCCSVAGLCPTLLHGLQHARLPCPSPSPGACSVCKLSHSVVSNSLWHFGL